MKIPDQYLELLDQPLQRLSGAELATLHYYGLLFEPDPVPPAVIEARRARVRTLAEVRAERYPTPRRVKTAPDTPAQRQACLTIPHASCAYCRAGRRHPA